MFPYIKFTYQKFLYCLLASIKLTRTLISSAKTHPRQKKIVIVPGVQIFMWARADSSQQRINFCFCKRMWSRNSIRARSVLGKNSINNASSNADEDSYDAAANDNHRRSTWWWRWMPPTVVPKSAALFPPYHNPTFIWNLVKKMQSSATKYFWILQHYSASLWAIVKAVCTGPNLFALEPTIPQAKPL